MKLRARMRLVVAATMASALILAGCSSSESSSGPSGGGSTVEVGTPYVAQTAASTPTPETALAADVAAKWINSHGGLRGHPIKVNKCDDHFTASGASACVRQFADNKKIVAIVGGEDCFTDASKA